MGDVSKPITQNVISDIIIILTIVQFGTLETRLRMRINLQKWPISGTQAGGHRESCWGYQFL